MVDEVEPAIRLIARALDAAYRRKRDKHLMARSFS
jgi:hypothetical protein